MMDVIHLGNDDMTKKTKLIPFDYQKYKNGAKAYTKDGREVVECHLFEKRKKFNLVALIKEDDECQSLLGYNIFGEHCLRSNADTTDLMIEEKLEERTFWVNVYPSGETSIKNCFVGFFNDEKQADQDNDGLPIRIGKLKVTYTEEDLIK